MVAVLTADLVNSRSYDKAFLKEVLLVLKEEFDAISKEHDAIFTLFRGDSFQGVIKDPKDALQIALRLKTAVLKVVNTEQKKSNIPVADVRIAIGIGEADYNEKAIAESNGEAFHFSGLTLDSMKEENKKLSLKTSNENTNNEFKVSLNFLDSLAEKWSIASAEVIYYLLKGMKEQQIADLLQRSQAAINLRKKAAGWEEVQLLLHRFNQVF
ncbi:MAG: SatD family protein [Flavobacteriaceae bacterium]|nr:SatD family protein [Flavobacteriaceae bacterium]